MADLQGIVNTAEIALVSATLKTVIQLTTPANHRIKILGWGVYFDGTTSAAEPVVVSLVRQTSTGTMTPVTPVKRDPSVSETILTTAAINASVEPTTTDIIESKEVHPQSGYEKIYPFSQEIIIGGSGRVGIICTAPNTVNVIGYVMFEE